jgi:hypothetical protein
MIIYTIRFTPHEDLSFYQIAKELIELERTVDQSAIEMMLTQSQFAVLKPVMDLIFPPFSEDQLPKGLIGYFGEIPIRLLVD